VKFVACISPRERVSADSLREQLQTTLGSAGKSDVTRGWEAAASGHAALGQWDRAFALAETITQSTPTLDWIIQVGSVWRPAAHDPRMRALCTRTHWNCDRLIGMLDRAVPLQKSSALSQPR
jgi:hypothetical protein